MSLESEIQNYHSKLWRVRHPEKYKECYTISNKKYYQEHKEELNKNRKNYKITRPKTEFGYRPPYEYKKYCSRCSKWKYTDDFRCECGTQLRQRGHKSTKEVIRI